MSLARRGGIKAHPHLLRHSWPRRSRWRAPWPPPSPRPRVAQQVRMRLDPGVMGEGPERPAGMLRPHWGVALGAQHQVELDRPGGLAWLDEQQPQRRVLTLLLLVVV